MSDSVLSGVRDCPFDWSRWAVAGDWLEDRDDPRSGFFHAVHDRQTGVTASWDPYIAAVRRLLGDNRHPCQSFWDCNTFGAGYEGPAFWYYADGRFEGLRWVPTKVFVSSDAITPQALESIGDSLAFGLAVHHDFGQADDEEAKRAGVSCLVESIRGGRCGWIRSFELKHAADGEVVRNVLDCIESLEGLQELTLADVRLPRRGLERLAGLRRLKSLVLEDCRVNDDAPLDGVMLLPKLDRLSVWDMELTSLDPAALLHQDQLTHLFFMERSLRAEWLEPVRRMERLQSFEVWNNHSPERVLPVIGGLVSLRSVVLRNQHGFTFTRRLRLDPLADLITLERLALQGNNIGARRSAVLSPLGGLRALKELTLDETGLCRSGRNVLVPLGGCSALERLELSGNGLASLGGRVLAPLRRLQNLRALDLSGNGFHSEQPDVVRLLETLGMRAVRAYATCDRPHALFNQDEMPAEERKEIASDGTDTA